MRSSAKVSFRAVLHSCTISITLFFSLCYCVGLTRSTNNVATLESREDLILHQDYLKELQVQSDRILQGENSACKRSDATNIYTDTYHTNMEALTYMSSQQGMIEIVGGAAANLCPAGNDKCVSIAYKAAKNGVKGKNKKYDGETAKAFEKIRDEALLSSTTQTDFLALTDTLQNMNHSRKRKLQAAFLMTPLGAAVVVAALTAAFVQSGPNDTSGDPDFSFFESVLEGIIPSTVIMDVAANADSDNLDVIDQFYNIVLVPLAIQAMQFVVCMSYTMICWWESFIKPEMPCTIWPSYCTS